MNVWRNMNMPVVAYRNMRARLGSHKTLAEIDDRLSDQNTDNIIFNLKRRMRDRILSLTGSRHPDRQHYYPITATHFYLKSSPWRPE